MERSDNPAFASTGPHGHRGRMRGRLLAGAGALADYEILEMLLFLGIPRRDTKPQAKGLINQFGSFAGALGAPTDELGAMPPRVAEVFALVVDSAALLAKAERVERVVLADWDALDRYLSAPSARAGGFSALLLNNRNQLLAECRLPGEEPAEITRVLLRNALERHATAAFLVRNAGEGAASVTRADRALLAHVRPAAAALSVLVHDMVVLGAGEWLGVGGG